MNTCRVGILTVVVLALGVTTATATPPTGFNRTELARSTIADPITASANEASWRVGGSPSTQGSRAAGTATPAPRKFEGEVYSGTFTFTPVEGDCVTSPATNGRVQGYGILTS